MNDFYIIHGWMNRELKLKGTTKEVYAFIYGFSADGNGGCWASEKKIAETIGVTDRSIRNAISELEEKGLIKNIGVSIYKTNTYVAIVPASISSPANAENFSTPENNSAPPRKTFPLRAEKNSANNKEDSKSNNNYNTQICEIFNYWNSLGIVRHRDCSDKIKKAIVKLLTNGRTVESIKKAIYNYYTVLSDTNYFFSYKWTLLEFLSRPNALPQFEEGGSQWERYKNKPVFHKPNAFSDNIVKEETDESARRERYREEMSELLPEERLTYEEWLKINH